MSLLTLHQQQRYAQYIGPTSLVTVDGSVHWSGPLAVGARYALLCPETDVYVRQGGAGISVSSSEALLPRGTFFLVNSDDLTSNRVAVMTATGLGGTLRVTRVDSLAGLPTGTHALHEAQYFSAFLGPTLKRAVDVVSGALTLPRLGRYRLYSVDDGATPADDVYIVQGASGLVADTTVMYLPRGTSFDVNADDATNDTIAVLSATGNTGALFRATRVDAV